MKAIQTPSGKILFMTVCVVFLLLVGCFFLIPSWAQEGTMTPSVDYRDVPWIGSRNLIWIVAQLHLLFGGFVLGVPIFAWICEIIAVRSRDLRYYKLAKEFIELLTASLAMTAYLGALLLLCLVILYPKLVNYFTGIFWPTYYVYVLLFFLETFTLYLYWRGFETMQNRKGLHLFLGFLLNLFGFFVMIVPNTWASFQASPVVLPEGMGSWEKAWAASNNVTWWPLNIHRLLANVVLGGFVCGAYAAIRYLGSRTPEERSHYDWMGYIGNFIGIFGLLPLPFAGYWLMLEIYRYNQQMGITLMGGFLSWLFILQAVLIGMLFLGSNYYFWLGLAHRTENPERFKKPILGMLLVLLVCFAIWLTPHSLVASLQEARAIGGTHHPLLGVFGVMSAKMTAVNLMILTTFASFLMYWQANKQATVSWARTGRLLQIGLILLAGLYIIWAGIYGYFVPAVVRIYVLSISQVLAVLSVLILVTIITALSLRNAKTTKPLAWGRMPAHSQYVLVMNAVIVVLTMSLMGVARSGSRVHWHIYGVLEDTSPYAFTPALGPASFFKALATFLFFLMVIFLFWVMFRTTHRRIFSTQYFFMVPFLFWLVSLPEKLMAGRQPIGKRVGNLGKAVAAGCGVLIIFIYLSNQIPQQASLPPEKEVFDFNRLTSQRDLIQVGQKLFFGKGQCALCHSIGPSETARAPDLQGIGAKLTQEFIVETLTRPEAYLYRQYDLIGPPRPFPAKMPAINKPPIGLSEPELLAVIAFVQSLGGEVTVQPDEVRSLMGISASPEGP